MALCALRGQNDNNQENFTPLRFTAKGGEEAAVPGGGNNALGEPRFLTARLVRDPDLSAKDWGSTQRYGFGRLIRFRDTPPGFTYSPSECSECDPTWNVPAASTGSQRGLSAIEAMAVSELDAEQVYNAQQGQRNLAQLSIHAAVKSE